MEYVAVALIVICIVLKIISKLESDLRFAEAKIENHEEQIKKGAMR